MSDSTPNGQLPGRHWWDADPGANPDDGPPAWWPYASELPGWHAWRGVNGLVYARLLKSSPPIVVRGEDAVDLRDQIRRENFFRF